MNITTALISSSALSTSQMLSSSRILSVICILNSSADGWSSGIHLAPDLTTISSLIVLSALKSPGIDLGNDSGNSLTGLNSSLMWTDVMQIRSGAGLILMYADESSSCFLLFVGFLAHYICSAK